MSGYLNYLDYLLSAIIIVGVALQIQLIRSWTKEQRTALGHVMLKINENSDVFAQKEIEKAEQANELGRLGVLYAQLAADYQRLTQEFEGLESRVSELEKRPTSPPPSPEPAGAAGEETQVAEPPKQAPPEPDPLPALMADYERWMDEGGAGGEGGFTDRYEAVPCSVDKERRIHKKGDYLTLIYVGRRAFIFPARKFFTNFKSLMRRTDLLETDVPNCFECIRTGSGSLTVVRPAEIARDDTGYFVEAKGRLEGFV